MAIADRFLKKIPQYTRNQRHITSVLQHGSLRKITNLIQVEWERKLKRIEIKGRPYILIIDPCNYCNLQCPLCPTGIHELGRPQSMMSFDNFKKYFDLFSPFLFETYLHNWGESLLNPEIFRMVAHAQDQNVGTNLSSNFAQVDSSAIDCLLDCGLEYLVISLDGTNQQTYSQYRIRGNYERVLESLETLIRKRNQRHRKWPVVEWQYIVMKHNQHEIPEAEKLAKMIGVDFLRFIPVGMPFETKNRAEVAQKWFPTAAPGISEPGNGLVFGQSVRPGPCFYLFRSMAIHPDGGISPCCIVHRKSMDFADLNSKEIDAAKIWNNHKYLSARSLYSPEKLQNRGSTVCDACDLFEFHATKRSIPIDHSLNNEE